ncbi:hypothetical protein J6590_048584 [Homalodisca vitripennis]|nr:hypothetical protein J6590_048584 [Homalodisca vitripennis]
MEEFKVDIYERSSDLSLNLDTCSWGVSRLVFSEPQITSQIVQIFRRQITLNDLVPNLRSRKYRSKIPLTISAAFYGAFDIMLHIYDTEREVAQLTSRSPDRASDCSRNRVVSYGNDKPSGLICLKSRRNIVSIPSQLAAAAAAATAETIKAF